MSDMGDWVGLVGNSLWVLGLAVWMAALSMAHYQARAEKGPVLSRLVQPGFQLALVTGAWLICAGLLLTSRAWWEKGIWGVCAALCIAWAARSWRGRRATREGRE